MPANSNSLTSREITTAQTIAIERVDHIGIRVRNLDSALGFYRVLGFSLVGRAEGDDAVIIRNEHQWSDWRRARLRSPETSHGRGGHDPTGDADGAHRQLRIGRRRQQIEVDRWRLARSRLQAPTCASAHSRPRSGRAAMTGQLIPLVQ
jgi:hypothetical protein